jgi:hypothetical protein
MTNNGQRLFRSTIDRRWGVFLTTKLWSNARDTFDDIFLNNIFDDMISLHNLNQRIGLVIYNCKGKL